MSFREKPDFDKKHIISQIFRRNNITFADSDDITWLLEMSTLLKFKRGSYVYMEGDTVRNFYIILSGSIEVSKHTDHDTKKIMSFLREGNMLGMPELFCETHIVTTHCLSDTEVAAISKQDFFDKVIENRNILLQLLKMNSDIIRSIENSIVIETAENKVKNYLRWLGRESGIGSNEKIQIYRKHTHEEIGEMLSLSRETITKTLNQLKEKGVIDITKDHFIINQKSLINTLSNFDESHVGFYGSEG